MTNFWGFPHKIPPGDVALGSSGDLPEHRPRGRGAAGPPAPSAASLGMEGVSTRRHGGKMRIKQQLNCI